MRLVETTKALGAELGSWRRRGDSIGLVPTMGALHRGHRSLVDAAVKNGDTVALSLFVNPLQFDDPGDLERYPRDLQADLALAEAAGVELVFAPGPTEMYPAGEPVVRVDPGRFGSLLEGSRRPGHFVGVATVVTKLFALFGPERAYFGEKDFEQLCVIRHLVEDLSFPLEVVACPTVREPDGLALSSRNVRLDPAQRRAANVLARALAEGRRLVSSGDATDPGEVEAAMAALIATEALVDLDYAAVRDATSLEPVTSFDREVRLLVAASVGPVHLIDNLGASPGGAGGPLP